jgi:RimJ/RimL family protein N-acetyltransferase
MVRLEPFKLKHFFFVSRLVQDPDIKFSLGLEKNITNTKSLAYWILRSLKLINRTKRDFIIFKDHQLIGVIGYNLVQEELGSAHVWIYIDKSFQSKGLGYESMHLLLNLLKQKKVMTIYTKVRSENLASMQLFYKLNFEIDRVATTSGSWVYLKLHILV